MVLLKKWFSQRFGMFVLLGKGLEMKEDTKEDMPKEDLTYLFHCQKSGLDSIFPDLLHCHFRNTLGNRVQYWVRFKLEASKQAYVLVSFGMQ